MGSQQRPFSGSSGTWLLIACHVLIVLPLAWHLNIWSDEASSLHTTQNGLIDTLRNAAAIERQAPLYFWVLSLWRYLSGSVFFARLLSVICSVASIWLLSRLANRLFRPRPALLITAFVALHPILIWASLEIRVYAAVMLITIGLISLFFAGFANDAPKRSAKVGFLVLAILALYTNYYLGFLLVGCFAALLLTARWKAALNYLLLMAAAGVAFSPLLLTFASQFRVNSQGFVEERSLVEGIRRIWTHVLTFLLPADIVAGEKASPVGMARLWLVRAAIVVIGIWAAVRWRRISERTVAFAAMTATIICWLLAAYFLLGSWFVATRHASVLFIPLILTAASLLDDLIATSERVSEKVTRYLGLAFGVVVLAFFSYALINLYPNGAKPGDWIRVGHYIEQNEHAGQPIIIFHTYDAMSLPYQYDGVNEILPKDHFMDFDFASPFADAQHMKTRTDFTISQFPPNAAEVWLITNDECGTPGICDQLEDFVHSNYNVVSDKTFYLQRVRLLSKK